MTRIVAVLAKQNDSFDREILTAMAEDTYEVVAGLQHVTPVLVTSIPELEEIVWPGTEVITIADDTPLREIFGKLGAEQAAIVSADAPDLPPLLIGKLFRELGRAPLAVCPSLYGGAVAIAAALPLPDWVHPDLDADNPVQAMREQAPGRRMIATGPGWHRLRKPDDLRLLDPGLEGWDNLRALVQ